MSETSETEFFFRQILPGEKLSFGKFSADSRFFIFLTDEDRYLKSYLYNGTSLIIGQKLYVYSLDENRLHFLGDFRGDYRGLWFSNDIRYAAITRAERGKNLIVFNLETFEKQADVSIKATDTENAWHGNADTANGYLHCNYGFDSLNFDVKESGGISLRWFLSMRYGPDGGPGATYGSANHVYAEAEISPDGQTRILRETFGTRDDHNSYARADESGKYYFYAHEPDVVYRSADNAVQLRDFIISPVAGVRSLINFKLIDESTKDFLVAVRTKPDGDDNSSLISVYRTSAPDKRDEFASAASDYFSSVDFTPDNSFAVWREAGTWRLYDLNGAFSAASSPPPPRVLDLNVPTNYTKIFADEKSITVAALVYGDFTIWKLNSPPAASRASLYMDEIIRREEKARRRQLKKDMLPHPATWREILLATALIFAFGMIFNYCNR